MPTYIRFLTWKSIVRNKNKRERERRKNRAICLLWTIYIMCIYSEKNRQLISVFLHLFAIMSQLVRAKFLVSFRSVYTRDIPLVIYHSTCALDFTPKMQHIRLYSSCFIPLMYIICLRIKKKKFFFILLSSFFFLIVEQAWRFLKCRYL